MGLEFLLLYLFYLVLLVSVWMVAKETAERTNCTVVISHHGKLEANRGRDGQRAIKNLIVGLGASQQIRLLRNCLAANIVREYA